ETGALEAVVDVIEGNHRAAAVSLADGDLKDESRDGDQEDGHEIGNEPLQPIVIVELRRVAQQVSHAGTTAHGGEEEGRAGRPDVAAIISLVRGWGEPPTNLPQHVHVDGPCGEAGTMSRKT